VNELVCEIRYAEVEIENPEIFLCKVRDLAIRFGSKIVCFDADKISGKTHAETALRHASRSIASGSSISNSFEMEALLYAAGSRQCSVATSFGLHAGNNRLYIGCCPGSDPLWDLLADSMCFHPVPEPGISPDKYDRLIQLFGITQEEVSAVGKDRIEDLVLERVVLLDVNK